jgi:hypothetical protein
VVLDVHGEMPLAPPKRNPLRHRPARERAVPLEPEVVVQTPCGVALYDEARPLGAAVRSLAEGLRSFPRTAFLAVVVEAHLWIVAINATLSSPTRLFLEKSPAREAVRCRG